MNENPPQSLGWSRADGLACLACVLVGGVLAVAPHLATLAQQGTLAYLADGDDVLYLAVARVPYHGENTLRDPFCRPTEHVPCLYSWLQFVPLAKLARWVGLPPVLQSLAWRALGGPLLGGALFVLFRRLLATTHAPTAWALGCSLVCLADAGFVSGRSLVQSLALLPHLLHGSTPQPTANALAQYRVVTPLMNLPFLLLLAASLVPGGPRRTRDAFWSILWLGLCFQLYFFYWTAAAAALAGAIGTRLVLASLNAEARPAHLAECRFLALVLAGGLLIGLPQVYVNAQTFADPAYRPILERLSRGQHLAPDDPARTMYLRNAWALAKLALGAWAILVARLPGLGVLWWLTLAGFALANSALVTGLEFENYHWAYVYSPCGEILLLAALALWLDRKREVLGRALALLWIVPAALVTIALVWRPFEALHAPEAVALSKTLAELRPMEPALAALGSDRVLAGPRAANVALLLTRCGQLYQEPHTAHSSVVPDQEVNERHALNGWLLGLDLDGYKGTALPERFQVGPSARPEWRPLAVADARAAIFQRLMAGSAGDLVEKYRPDALLLPATSPRPERLGPWTEVGHTAQFRIWRKETPLDSQE